MSPRARSRSVSFRPLATTPSALTFDYTGRRLQFQFVQLAQDRTVDQLGGFGARGTGKTTMALQAMLFHATNHHRRGLPLPTIWLGIRDTLENHKVNLYKTLREPLWEGAWQLEDGGRVAIHEFCGVRVELMGIRDAQSMNKLRTQCHGVWFEEAVPVHAEEGLSDTAWFEALGSRRLDPPARDAPDSGAHWLGLLTSNLGDIGSWCYRHFEEAPAPGVAMVNLEREGQTPAYAQQLEQAYGDRPDLRARLVEGRWAALQLGAEIAVGYSAQQHVLPEVWAPLEGEDMWLGHDAWHTPATVVCQRQAGRVVVLASLVTERAGMYQHVTDTVLPWLHRHARWVFGGRRHGVMHRYDPSAAGRDQSDYRYSAVSVLRELLPGAALPAPVSWPARWEPLRTVLAQWRDGRAVLQVNPGADTQIIRGALAGKAYFRTAQDGRIMRDVPFKPNPPWQDAMDALCYALGPMVVVPHVGHARSSHEPAVAAFNPHTWDEQRVMARRGAAQNRYVFDPFEEP